MEQELLDLLISIKGKGRIQLELHPDPKHTPAIDLRNIIRTGQRNKCRVESSEIPGRVKWFTEISEPFYDKMVDQFHNTY